MTTALEKYDEIKRLARDYDIDEHYVYAAMLIDEKYDEPGCSFEYLVNHTYSYILWEFHDSRNDDFDVEQMKRDLLMQVLKETNPPRGSMTNFVIDEECDAELTEFWGRYGIGYSENDVDCLLEMVGVENVVFFDYTYPENGMWHTSRYVAYTDIL